MRKYVLYGLIVLLFVGCRKHESDVRSFFYEHQKEFEYLRNAEFSRTSDKNHVAELKEELGIWSIKRYESDCDTIANYDEVKFYMEDDVHVDDNAWGCSYAYIYSNCPVDSFYYKSANTTQAWLSPHWCYFIEKGL